MIASGDEQAFGVFFNAHYPLLRPFLTKFFADPAQLEDALQETFIKVWINRDQLPGIENVKGWLYTIASRICINSIRKEMARASLGETLSDQQHSSSHTPHETTTAAELRRLIAEAVAGMPEARRRIYLLSREEAMKPAQIAETLSLSVNTVRNVLVSALKEIRSYLAKNGHSVPVIILLQMIS